MARHVTGLSQSADRYVYQTNTTDKRTWQLTFESITDDQREALDWFFIEVVNGPAEEFEYTDTDGVTRDVRFANTNLPWNRAGRNQWSVVISLEFDEEAINPSSSV